MSAIASIFGQIIFYIGLLKTRLVLKIFIVGFVASLLLALYAVALINIDNLERAIPGELLVLWGLLAPDNALACLTAVVTVRVATAVFVWVTSSIKEISSV